MNMIKRWSLLSVLSLSLLLFGGGLVFTGCANFGKASYKTVASVQVTADAAMTAWGDYVAKNHPGAAQEIKVRDAYNKYQAALLAVADAGQAYTAASGSTNAPTAQSVLNGAIAVASASLGDLITLLQTFGVKL